MPWRRTETEAGEIEADPGEATELDPGLIDPSFLRDRLGWDDARYTELRNCIARDGQASPILVRPHPTETGRYQAAFGHRRLRAAAELGRPVRCVVRPLTDRQLVIAQGQENSARTDLTFIERSLFALALLEAGYNRPTMMQALAIDKTTLSRLLKMASRLPIDIIEAIGPAPAIGRLRWAALDRAWTRHAADRPVDLVLESDAFLAADSNTRFEQLYRYLAKPDPKPRAAVSDYGLRRILSHSGRRIGTLYTSPKNFVLRLEEPIADGFGSYLLSRLEPLYDDYMRQVTAKPQTRHFVGR